MNLYIDPGTGSMLFAVMIGLVGFVTYFARVVWIKIKYVVSRGKVDKVSLAKIPLLIYAESKTYWNVFMPICRELDNRGYDFEYWTASQDDPAFSHSEFSHMKVRFIGEGNKAFSKLNLVQANVILSTTPGLNVYQWKRSQAADYYVHIMHSANEVAAYRMFGLDFYDAVLVSGQYNMDDIRVLEKKRNLPPKDLKVVGMPYMDELKARIDNSERPKHDRTCVLLAPSWGPNSLFNKFGSKILDELVKCDVDIIVRPHPQTLKSETEMITPLMEKYPDSDRLRWDRSSSNFESLHEADIMISDFSGVIFDFALAFDKPIIYSNTDFKTDCFDLHWLDKTPWTLEALPKMGLEVTDDNISNLGDLINRCLNDESFKKGRDAAGKETWECRGEGAKLIADYVVEKSKALSSAKKRK